MEKPIKTLANTINHKIPELPMEICVRYSKLRLNIRIKYLNNNLCMREKKAKMSHALHVNKFC